MENLLNYSLYDLKSKLFHEPFKYLVVDDIFKEDVYKQIDDFKLSKKRMIKCKPGARSQVGRVGGGKNYYVGGAGRGFKSFKPFTKTEQQINILKQMDNSISFWCNLFDTKEKSDYIVGYKYSLYTNKYGWNIHPDGVRKVISVLFYLDNTGWEEYSKYNGTQLYCIDDKYKAPVDIPIEKYWKQLCSVRGQGGISSKDVGQIKFCKNVHYKPNRMLVFLNDRHSYHGIYPMNLPDGMLRPCFQLNIWRQDGKTRYEQ